MIKKPFFGFGKPKLNYAGPQNLDQLEIEEIPISKKAFMMVKAPLSAVNQMNFQVGDKVQTGQKLQLSALDPATVISTVTGTITSISKKTGYMGQKYISIAVDAEKTDVWDDACVEALKTKDPEKAAPYLAGLPGTSNHQSLTGVEKRPETVVINGTDKDLLTVTQQMIVKSETDQVKGGVGYLKKIFGNSKIMLCVPPELSREAAETDVPVETVSPCYPNALPEMIMKDVFKKIVPAGMDCKSQGVLFLTPESIAALYKAFSDGKPPVSKIVTVIGKNEKMRCVRVRIGTPIKAVLNALQIHLESGDRLVVGGPMTGRSIYSEDVPVLSDTDTIMVQDSSRLALNSNDPCVNCGECIRACPAKIPVNMLVRLLENSLFEEAARDYDLLSCIECGLCSYVCEAKIPVFHYIMMGKYELALMAQAEEING